MLLILPRPAEEVTTHNLLAVNLQTCDEMSIVKNEDTGLFVLQIAKVCNPHTNQPAFFYALGIFQSEAACLTLFQEIVDAVEGGQPTFQLPTPDSHVLDQKDQEYDRPINPGRGYN